MADHIEDNESIDWDDSDAPDDIEFDDSELRANIERWEREQLILTGELEPEIDISDAPEYEGPPVDDQWAPEEADDIPGWTRAEPGTPIHHLDEKPTAGPTCIAPGCYTAVAPDKAWCNEHTEPVPNKEPWTWWTVLPEFDDIEFAQPTVLSVRDAIPLFYVGETNMVFGKSGCGKSWIGVAAALDVIRQGGKVVYWDWESGKQRFASRVAVFGEDTYDLVRDIDACRYVNGRDLIVDEEGNVDYSTSMMEAVEFLEGAELALMVLDTTGAAGASQNESNIYEWKQLIIDPWLKKHLICVLLLDHTAKDDLEGRRGAIGTQSKIAMIQGSVFFMHGDKWSKDAAGTSVLSCYKDNNGTHTVDEVSAHVTAFTNLNGEFVLDIKAPPDADSSRKELSDKINSVISEAGGEVRGIGKLAVLLTDKLGIGEKRARQLIRNLADDKDITETQNGQIKVYTVGAPKPDPQVSPDDLDF